MFEILISETTLEKIKDYYLFLCREGVDKSGTYLKRALNSPGSILDKMDLNTFTTLIIQSKTPKIFAESEVFHDERDWTLQEESILGDITVHMPVTFFNNGMHYKAYTNYSAPIDANLAYIPGALLQSRNGISSDLQEVIVDGVFNQQRYNDLYERRLLPQLLQINAQAQKEGKKAAVTIPGIGTGQFAGNYFGIIKKAFRTALESVLETHQNTLSNIDTVIYDPYEGDEPQKKRIGHINYSVIVNDKNGQLAYPDGTSSESHTLTSFVAWDHFSWPGNDFWVGYRSTDDGVKGASTNTMELITGVKGSYDPSKGSYEPPSDVLSWKALAKARAITFSGPIFVVMKDGRKQSLETFNRLETSNPIDVVLTSYAEKIKGIGSYYSGAKTTAEALLKTLQDYREMAYHNPSPENLREFNNKVVNAIEEVLPELQRDLGWGDYLSNMAKEISNAITICLAKMFSCNYSGHQGFFVTKQSMAKQHALRLREDINHVADGIALPH